MILLKELRTYSTKELMSKLEIENDDFQKIIKILDEKKILKYNYRGEIQFSYVGIVIVKSKTIFILPKYVECKNKENEIQVMKQVIKLLNEFTEREKLDKNNIDSFSLEQEALEDNLIPIICFLLDDYIENSIYINEIDSSELNGDGEINWDKTIDLVDPIVINKQWFYSDLITNRSIIDNDRYITRLHGAIINECMEFLRDTGLNLVLTYNVDEIENSLEDLDEVDRIDREVENEIMVQFNDRKKRVLQAIRVYIDKRSDTSDVNLLLYGTRNFKWVWEILCGYIFDNEFVKSGKKSKYEIYGIEPPKWYIDNRNSTKIDASNEYEIQKNRLTPDILKVVVYDDIRCLLILDAKYYNVRIENNSLKGNPGIDDITKQYLYNTTLKNYIEKNNINKIINAFVFPCEVKTYVQGEVVLDFMKQFSDVNINLIKFNVDEVINMYCDHKKYNLQYFISRVDSWNEKKN